MNSSSELPHTSIANNHAQRVGEDAKTAQAAAVRWAGGIGGAEGGDESGRPGKSTCLAVWKENLAVFEVIKPRGDSLRSMGTSWRDKTMLHAEEGLWLAERGLLAVQTSCRSVSDTTGPSAAMSAVEPASATTQARKRGGDPEGREKRESGNLSNDGEVIGVSTANSGGRSATINVAISVTRPSCSSARSDDKACGDLTSSVTSSKCAKPPNQDMSASGTGASHSGGAQNHVAVLNTRRQHQVPGDAAAVQRPPTLSVDGFRDAHGMRDASTIPMPAPFFVEELLPADHVETSARGEMKEAKQSHRRRKEHDGKTRNTKKRRTGTPEGAAPRFLSAGEVYEILARAGVSWECYRAYAELKRRSFIVRRQREDSVGFDDRDPRAKPLRGLVGSWDEHVTAERAGTSSTHRDDKSASILSVPVSFHVYNPSPSFRKRSPGPPDSLLAVCRYTDPMPTHQALAALARRHRSLGRRAPDDNRFKAGECAGGGECGDNRDGDYSLEPEDKAIRAGSGGHSVLGDESIITVGDFQESSVGTVIDGGVDGGVDGGGADAVEGGRTGDVGGCGGKQTSHSGAEAVSIKNDAPRGVKVAVVSPDGGVHLFDVGLHS